MYLDTLTDRNAGRGTAESQMVRGRGEEDQNSQHGQLASEESERCPDSCFAKIAVGIESVRQIR